MATLRHTHTEGSRLDLDLAYEKLPATAARVFRLLPTYPGPDYSASAISALADLSESESGQTLASLVQAHLIEVAPGSGERWRLLDSARSFAQQLSDNLAAFDGREQAQDRLLDYFLSMTEAADDQLRGLPSIPVAQEFTDRNDALAWLDAERASLTAAVELAADSGRDQVAASLPLLMAHYLGFQRRFEELLSVTRISLDAALRLCNQGAEGDALTNLGLALHGLDRNDQAITAHRDAAAIFHEIGDPHGEANALNNLGLALHGLDRNDQAITAHRDAAAIFHEIGDRHGDAMTLGNLGNVMQDLGRFDEAASAYREAAAIFHETDDERSELMALESLDLLKTTL